MKTDFANSNKEPRMKNLIMIMFEVAEEAKMNQKIADQSIEKAMKFHLAEIERKYKTQC